METMTVHTRFPLTTELNYKASVLQSDGEGNGNPLQYSSLENPVDRGAWWAAVHGVAQSQTRLKQLSRGNSSLQSDLCSNSDSRQCAFIPNYSSHMTRSPSWHYLQPPKHIFVWIT